MFDILTALTFGTRFKIEEIEYIQVMPITGNWVLAVEDEDKEPPYNVLLIEKPPKETNDKTA